MCVSFWCSLLSFMLTSFHRFMGLYPETGQIDNRPRDCNLKQRAIWKDLEWKGKWSTSSWHTWGTHLCYLRYAFLLMYRFAFSKKVADYSFMDDLAPSVKRIYSEKTITSKFDFSIFYPLTDICKLPKEGLPALLCSIMVEHSFPERARINPLHPLTNSLFFVNSGVIGRVVIKGRERWGRLVNRRGIIGWR